jgi:hypothetical protein
MNGVNLGTPGAKPAGGAVTLGVNDDVLLTLGTDADGVALLRSATLNADTALTGVLIGTPDTHALAANSLIIANKTADGDVLIAGNDGGTSRQILYADVSTGVTYLGMKDGTPGSATSVGDVYTAGKLEVDGGLYVDATSYLSVLYVNTTSYLSDTYFNDGKQLILGTSNDVIIKWNTTDTNANHLLIYGGVGDGTNVPVIELAQTFVPNSGLWDGVTQPLFAVLEKSSRYATVTNATSTGANATLTTVTAGPFTDAVAGDTVRITAGANAIAGWYKIVTVTSAVEVILDRTWCTGAVAGGTLVAYHSFTGLSAEGILTRHTYDVPTDSSVEIDKDGWILQSGLYNQLYHRSGATWRAVQNSVKTVEAVATTNAILEAESGSVFTNLGDADGATCTLPADAPAGTNFTFTLQVAQEFKIIVGKAASKFYLGGVISTDDGGNDMYVSADDEGESITLCCDGNNGWFPLAINGTWSVVQP